MSDSGITGEGPGAIAAALRNLADALEADTTVRWGLESEEIGHASKTTITVWTMTPAEQPAKAPHVYLCGTGTDYRRAIEAYGAGRVTWVPDVSKARGYTPTPDAILALGAQAGSPARDAHRYLTARQQGVDERRIVGLGQTWCSAWRGDTPGVRCNTFLSADGSCSNAARHL